MADQHDEENSAAELLSGTDSDAHCVALRATRRYSLFAISAAVLVALALLAVMLWMPSREAARLNAVVTHEVGGLHQDLPIGIITTGVSKNAFHEAFAMVRTAQQFMPAGWKIVVYDLVDDWDEDMHKQIKSWWNVEYRLLNVTIFNEHGFPDLRVTLLYLTNCNWKPFVILESLSRVRPDGMVIWGDASARFRRPLSPIIETAFEVGVIGRKTTSPVSEYTHPAMFTELANLSSDVRHVDIHDYDEAPMICGCINFWRNSEFVMKHVLAPLTACASRDECLRPPGASGFKINNSYSEGNQCHPGYQGHCHRGDQSALSILLFEVFGSNVSNTPYKVEEVFDYVGTERGSHNKEPPYKDVQDSFYQVEKKREQPART